jgi:hypothetical protein
VDGGRHGGLSGSGTGKGTWPAEAGAGQRCVSRGGEGGARGLCVKEWASRGKEAAGPGPREQCQF